MIERKTNYPPNGISYEERKKQAEAKDEEVATTTFTEGQYVVRYGINPGAITPHKPWWRRIAEKFHKKK